MDDTIRIGLVSSVSGTNVRITYPDRDNTVTEELPLVTNGVYRVPSVGEIVVVAHMSNGTTGGFCLGGLGKSNQDYLLSDLYARLTSIENRLSALEAKDITHDSQLDSLDQRVSALEG